MQLMQKEIDFEANGIGNVVGEQFLGLVLEGNKEGFDISNVSGNDGSLVIWPKILCVDGYDHIFPKMLCCTHEGFGMWR